VTISGQVDKKPFFLPDVVNFEKGKAQIDSLGYASIAIAADYLGNNPDKNIEVGVYYIGCKKEKVSLDKRRIEIVINELIEKYNIDPKRIQPKYDSSILHGWGKKRCLLFLIYDPLME